MAGARAVYGAEEVARTYGDVVRCRPSACVHQHDGMTLELAGRAAAASSTRPATRATTTASGTSAAAACSPATPSACRTASSTPRDGAWMLPTTTPVQFEPDALRASVAAHAGVRPGVHVPDALRPRRRRAAARRACCSTQLDAMVALARALRDAPERHARLKDGLARDLPCAACARTAARSPTTQVRRAAGDGHRAQRPGHRACGWTASRETR